MEAHDAPSVKRPFDHTHLAIAGRDDPFAKPRWQRAHCCDPVDDLGKDDVRLSSWRHIMTGLVDDHHVVTVYMRGIGIDTPPQDGFGKRDMARQLAVLLDAILVDLCAVIGHDMGALVAYAFARLFPTRTTHLGELV